ncbi:MAG: BatA domain-containing protein [Candidatus Binatia bacterium]
MEFLNPGALYALALLPLLIIPYLIQRRPRRRLFSSVFLLRELAPRPTARPWRRLYLPPIFFLQLLLLAFLLSALGEPSLSFRPANVALVLDNSASMQAMEGEKSRFQLAQNEAAKILGALPAQARADLYLLVPRLTRLTVATLTASEAIARLNSIKPLDLAEPAIDYAVEFARLVEERRYERLHFLTDHPAEGQNETVRAVSIGHPKGNLAITAFQVSRRSWAAPELEARLTIRNFSTTDGKFSLLIKGSGKALASRAYTVPAGKDVEASFENLPAHPYYEAEIDARDGLALDNRRFAAPPPQSRLKILAVSPRPEALSSLRAIPGVEIQVVSPQAYEKETFEPHALEIFHYSAPAALPDSHALFVLPPKENPVVEIGAVSSRAAVSGWREPHPLTRYINFALFRPAYARPLKTGTFGEAIIQGPDGALAVALEQKNFRYLALGFDPFPFLGQQNLPVSIFTLNALEWFHRARGGNTGVAGEPLAAKFRAGETVLAPDGTKITPEKPSGLFAFTYTQGIYRATGGETERVFAVNFADERESDLREPPAIRLGGDPAAATARASYASLWPYLLLAALALLMLEWFLIPSATRERPATESARQFDDFRWA